MCNVWKEYIAKNPGGHQYGQTVAGTYTLNAFLQIDHTTAPHQATYIRCSCC